MARQRRRTRDELRVVAERQRLDSPRLRDDLDLRGPAAVRPPTDRDCLRPARGRVPPVRFAPGAQRGQRGGRVRFRAWKRSPRNRPKRRVRARRSAHRGGASVVVVVPCGTGTPRARNVAALPKCASARMSQRRSHPERGAAAEAVPSVPPPSSTGSRATAFTAASRCSRVRAASRPVPRARRRCSEPTANRYDLPSAISASMRWTIAGCRPSRIVSTVKRAPTVSVPASRPAVARAPRRSPVSQACAMRLISRRAALVSTALTASSRNAIWVEAGARLEELELLLDAFEFEDRLAALLRNPGQIAPRRTAPACSRPAPPRTARSTLASIHGFMRHSGVTSI